MSFDALAPHYRWMEALLASQKLHRCRTAFLDQLAPPGRILLAGEGHGRALAECRRRFPDARVVCVDASRRMLDQARRQLHRLPPAAAPVEFVHADILRWPAPGHAFDLIVTNFFLDCFPPEQLQRVVERLAHSAMAGANWVLADFHVPAGRLRRVRSRLILWSMYLFFRCVTRLPAQRLTAPDKFLQAAGFNLRRRIESEWGLLHSDWWQRPA